MDDIFKNLDNEIAKKKDEKNLADKEKDDIWKKIEKIEKKTFDKHFKSDFEKLIKILDKNIKEYENIHVSSYGDNIDVTRTYHLPDDISTETLRIQMVDKKRPSMSAKIEHLKKYKFDENNFALRVSSLGDDDHTSLSLYKPTKESELFEIDQKDEAYKYFNKLFIKEILHLDKKDN